MGNTYEEDEEEDGESIETEDSANFGLSSMLNTGLFTGANQLSNYTSNLEDDQEEQVEFDAEYTKSKQYSKKLMPSEETIDALLAEINS
jgi:hypothetical protein